MFIRYLYTLLLIQPLHRLYFHGPNLYGVGFWESMKNTTICAQLTEQSEILWLQNPTECAAMIQRKYDAYETMIEISVYFFVLYLLSSNAISMGYQVLWKHRQQSRPIEDVRCQKIMYYISNND